ncbi:MAG: signal recognition particle-docking protein FtsY [Holosporales bacterium]|jgi:fused signal recognition particle receptor|nr:signal recognition particle-docking protein FtsY [Holosporales bacterium]
MSFFKKLTNIFYKSGGSNLEIEESLIEADFGPRLALSITQTVARSKDPQSCLRETIGEILEPYVSDIPVNFSKKPFTIMMVGVNGSGKTTTIAKLANFYKGNGLRVDIAACDTFRAAATEQLSVWAQRIGCEIFRGGHIQKDPASVAYDALSKTQGDVLLVDTAGRLHNNCNLMEELSKISKVLQKIDAEAPDRTYVTIDSTNGQNTVEQIREFSKFCNVSGIVLNKIDGGAKGGSILRIVEELKIPIVAVGKGEDLLDIDRFSVDEFLKDLG